MLNLFRLVCMSTFIILTLLTENFGYATDRKRYLVIG